MKVELGYGRKNVSVEIPGKNLGSLMHPRSMEQESTEQEIIRKSLRSPIGSLPLAEIVKPGESVVIVTSDVTRPMPSYKVLPELLTELEKNGIADGDITIVFGLGNHRRQTSEEMQKLVGEDIYRRIRCVDSDQDDIICLGTTSSGTPVDIFRPVVEADRRICLGNIDYHYFAGYSGGYKAIMPGVSTESAIQMNHRHMVKELASTGNLKENPVRDDIEEVSQLITMDFLVNVVLDEHKQVAGSFAGDPIEAHRRGCEMLDEFYKCTIKQKADVVIVSAGGFPKDINLYQAQKALDNAKYAVKDGGEIILVAACSEGLGESTFERWMVDSPSPEWMVEEIQRNFVLGGHKAAAIGLVMRFARIKLVSDMDGDFVKGLFMEPYNKLQEALDDALQRQGPEALVHVMPIGGSTLPTLE